MSTRDFLPVIVFALVVVAPALTPRSPACPVTYCVSLSDSVQVQSGSGMLQPGLGLLLVAQLFAVGFAASEGALLVLGARKHVPLSLIWTLNHLRALARTPTGSVSRVSATFWLPIESICSGRLTSKMLKAPSFFGPGRL